MNKNLKLIFSCLSMFVLIGAASCSSENHESVVDNTYYPVTCETSDYYSYSGVINSTKGNSVDFSLTSLFPAYEIVGATYNDTECEKVSENESTKNYRFTMPAKSVEIKVLNTWNELLTAGKENFLSFSSDNTYTAKSAIGDDTYNNDRYWGTPLILEYTTNAGIMTIATTTCFSENEEVLPSSAISVETETADGSNNIVGGAIVIDRSKAKVGSTKVVLRVKNGNRAGYDAIIVASVTFTE